ncbi:MAG TPA: DUF72 domain-containing protein [Sandaracinaceae bacterium]
MLFVACSGFPIAVSRYLAEFRAVEIADSEIGIPGTGTLRRWQREAPEGFVFTALAPAVIGASGFAEGGETDQALKNILSFCKKLEAMAVVFRVPEEVALNRSVAARAKKVLAGVRAAKTWAVLDAPHWNAAQVDKICEASGAVPARDPLTLAEAPKGELAYLALPGPAGYRSRYDEEALTRIADVCRRSTAATTFCVFRNIDMEANSKTLIDLLGRG